MKLSAWKYSLPFRKPLRTAGRTFRKREGIVLILSAGDITAFGEVAPLPGFSEESLSDAEAALCKHRSEIPGLFRSGNPVAKMESFFEQTALPPSCAFGLHTLTYDFEAKQYNVPFHQHLFGKPSRAVPVNGLISLLDDEDPFSSLKKLADAGFRTIKVKVGSDFRREQYHLKKIRAHYPSIGIRLDANRSWTLEEALTNLRALAPLNIEYCEEPLQEPTTKGYRLLAKEVGIPLAIDESVYERNDWQDLLSYTSIVILKPMITGSFTKINETVRLAGTLNSKAVITTSLESGIGRMVTAVMASGTGSDEAAHGLATGSLFREDLLKDDPFLVDGAFILPEDRAGLGKIDDINREYMGIKLFEEAISD